MKVYFDESGNTGCVVAKGDTLNFTEQPIFTVGAVICKTEEDIQLLLEKYNAFKNYCGIAKNQEIKGNDLLTRANNDKLDYFLKNVLDDVHFSVNIYDKRFYISTLLLLGLLGLVFQSQEIVMFYETASALAFQNDDFFMEYSKYISNPSAERFQEYLLFLKNYNYKLIGNKNAVTETAKLILDDNQEALFFDDFLTYGSYDDKNITNLINLNALGELIDFVRIGNEKESIEFIHDHIKEFESTIQSELATMGISIVFEDSKNNELIQLADNITSIVNHAFVRMKKHFENKEEWKKTSEWDMKLVSKLFTKISLNLNVKFTVPFQDWAATLCVVDMFKDDYPKHMRKNLFFNPMYEQSYLYLINNLIEYKKIIDRE